MVELIKNMLEVLLLVNTNRCPMRILTPIRRSENISIQCIGCRKMNRKIQKFRNIRKCR